MITRFAPTPSGFLHRGNAVNALLVSWLAAATDGMVVLRIDDLDTSRLRPTYVDDVFAVLRWLGVDWHAGPRDRTDLDASWSARRRLPRYRAALDAAVSSGLPVYACSCSRSAQRGPATGGCSGGCRTRGLRHEPGHTALRAVLPADTVVEVGDRRVRPADELGDFVVWRRDDLPAYQLASVVDDDDLAVTDVVRGVDLLGSTAAQLYLAPFLGACGFASARFWHHELITGDDGTKLSKSQQTDTGPLPRTAEERATLHRLATGLGAPLGIVPPDR